MSTANIPGPRGHWLLGSAREFQDDKLGFLQRCADQYGDVFQFRAGPTRLVVVNDVDEIKRILVDDAASYQKSRFTRDIFGRIMGNGLLISEGDFHRRQRRLSQPAFDAKRLRAYGEVAVRHAEAAAERWSSADDVEIQEEMTRVTLGVVAEALLGAALDEQSELLARAMSDLQEAGAILFSSSFVPPAWVPTRTNRLLKRAAGVAARLLEQLIAERQADPGDRGDLLSMLLLARDDDGQVMSARQVRDEALTLFLAGFETTANALTWTWYFLAKHPSIRAKLEEEVSRAGEGAPAVSDLDAMPFVSMVFKESLRMCCPIWAFNRSSIAPITIKGYPVSPKDVIIISPFLLHQKSQYFPDPERFEPERFSAERERQIPRFAFLPFGAGPRICIGARLAALEAELVLATLIKRFRLTLPQEYEAEREVFLSIRPKGGLRMSVEARTSSNSSRDALQVEQNGL